MCPALVKRLNNAKTNKPTNNQTNRKVSAGLGYITPVPDPSLLFGISEPSFDSSFLVFDPLVLRPIPVALSVFLFVTDFPAYYTFFLVLSFFFFFPFRGPDVTLFWTRNDSIQLSLSH